MANIIISLGGVAIKQPTEFGIEKFNLTKGGRVASGKMKLELIAKKRKFTCAYEVISGTALETLLSVVDGTTLFLTLVYNENGNIKTAVVYSGAIKAKKFRTDGVMYWKGVTFDLIEE